MIDILNTIDFKKLTVNVLIGYTLSWIYFLGTLLYFQKIFGKMKGLSINFGLSWIVWFIISYSLHKLNPKGEY